MSEMAKTSRALIKLSITSENFIFFSSLTFVYVNLSYFQRGEMLTKMVKKWG